MSQDTLVKLACSECKNINYHSKKNKKNREKLEIMKHCPTCGDGGKGKHTLHKERK